MNRVVLITGASSGIGAATAKALAGRHRLVLVARRGGRLDDLCTQINAEGGEALPIALDLTAANAPAEVVARSIERFGGLDAVINNAGVYEQAAIGAVTPEHLERHLRLNLIVPMLLAQAALPHLRGRRGGWIINVSSVAAEAAFTATGAYTASKAGLEAWSRVLREELRGTNVRVGVIAPGATDSEIWPATQRPDPERMCRAEDIAGAIRFMLELPRTANVDRLVVAPPGGAI